MRTFQINVLIQFLVSSTCFEHHVFNTRKTIRTCSLLWFVFSCVYVSSLAGGRLCFMIKIDVQEMWYVEWTSFSRIQIEFCTYSDWISASITGLIYWPDEQLAFSNSTVLCEAVLLPIYRVSHKNMWHILTYNTCLRVYGGIRNVCTFEAQ